MSGNELLTVATEFANNNNTDVLCYSGDIDRPFDDTLIDLCLRPARRKNVMLFLCTHGGNPDAAYRMARCLQNNYEKFTVFISGRCKSAGTLIAVGAHELVMTEYAEIGPLDVQLGKKDELFEMHSGLTVLNALTELQLKALEFFERGFIRLKVKSGGRITLKTATAIASDLAKGMMTPIMSQIDPMHVGEVSRAMRIGKDYGRRLSELSNNLQEDALNKLVEGYPSHGFVIDSKEAKTLFINLRSPSKDEAKLASMMEGIVRNPPPTNEEPIIAYLSNKQLEENNENHHQTGFTEGEEAASLVEGRNPEIIRDSEQGIQSILKELSSRDG